VEQNGAEVEQKWDNRANYREHGGRMMANKKELPDTSIIDGMTHGELVALAWEAKLIREQSQRVENYILNRLTPADSEDEMRATADRLNVDGDAYIAASKAQRGDTDETE